VFEEQDGLAHCEPLHLEPRVKVAGLLRRRVRHQVHDELGRADLQQQIAEGRAVLVLALPAEPERIQVEVKLLQQLPAGPLTAIAARQE